EVDGKYQLTRLLGQGALGPVFEAENEVFGRRVALRFLAGGLRADPDACERFIDEVRAAGGVDHENVVALLDVGQHPAFGPYAVMELVEGPSVAVVIAQHGPLTFAAASDEVCQVLSARKAAPRPPVARRNPTDETGNLHACEG